MLTERKSWYSGKTFSMFLLFILITGIKIYSQGNLPDSIKNYPGIPIIPYLERISDTNSENIWYTTNSMDSIETSGVYGVQLNDITTNQFSSGFSNNHFKLLPSQDGDNMYVTHNAIRYYTRACYTVWEAEGTPPENGDATLYFDTTKGVIEDGAVRTKDSTIQKNDTLIYGPYYAQNIFYTAESDSGERIQYTADFKLKKLTLDIGDPPNANDTICILQATTSRVKKNEWRIDSTQVLKQEAVTYGELFNTFTPHKIEDYDFSLADTIFTSDTSRFRASADYVQFKIIWKGNSSKVRLYVDKITVSDIRGRRLVEPPYEAQTLVLQQIQSDLGQQFGDRIAGWEAAGDELSFIDEFEPIRIVDSIVNVHGQGKSLWIAAGTGYNGRWGVNVGIGEINPFGSYSLFSFDEFYKRVKRANIISDYYLYTAPDPTYGSDFRDKKIKYMVDTVNGRFNKENVFWGASVQTGAYFDPGQSWIDLKEIESKELLYNINVHLMTGAKLISPYKYFAVIDTITDKGTALVNVYWITKNHTDDPLYSKYTPKWYTLKDTISPRLNGLMGKTLKRLTPVKHYLKIDALYPESTSPYEFVNYIQAGGGLYDTCLIELGIFQEPTDPAKKYFMPVNRYYSNKSRLTFGLRYLTGYNNWKLTDYVDTTNITLLASQGTATFIDTIFPGDANLYSIHPVVIDGGKLLYNETITGTETLLEPMTIENGATLTVNGTYTIQKDITVNDGGVLLLQPGANLVFQNGAKLILKGGLTAAGTSSNKITFDFTTQQSGNGINTEDEDFLTMTSCIIKNAVNGLNIIHRSRGTALVRYNKFENCFTGISLVNATSALIQGNEFINTQYAIFTSNVSGLNIISNQINGNNSNWPGMVLNSSAGYVRKNTISGHGYGIMFGNSSPFLGTNTIYNNNDNGLYIGPGSQPNLQAVWVRVPCVSVPIFSPLVGVNNIYNNGGNTINTTDGGAEIFIEHSSILLDYGCNIIADNRVESRPPYTTKNLMDGNYDPDSPIYARGNDWGTHPTYTLDERFGSLPVIYEPIGCIQPDNAIDCELIVYTTDGIAIDTFLFVYVAPDDQDELKELYAEASAFFEAGDYAQASQVYNEIITDFSSQKESFDAFAKLLVIERLRNSQPQAYEVLKNLYLASLNNITDTLMTKMILQLANLCLLNGGELNEAADAFQNIINNNPGTEEADFAEIDLYTTALLDTSTTLNKGGFEKVTASSFNEKLNNLLSKKFGVPNTKTKEIIIPKEYSLYQNYPNPFNPTTTIKYDLPKDGLVELEIYDILGRRITKLVSEFKPAGTYEQRFDASDLASGIYIYQLRSGEFVTSKKMMFVK